LSPGYHGRRFMGALKDSGSFASSIGSAFGTFGSGTATNLDKAAVVVGAAGAGLYAAGGLWQKTSFSGVGDMKSFIKGLNPHAEPAKLAAAEAKTDLTAKRGAEAAARTEATEARAQESALRAESNVKNAQSDAARAQSEAAEAKLETAQERHSAATKEADAARGDADRLNGEKNAAADRHSVAAEEKRTAEEDLRTTQERSAQADEQARMAREEVNGLQGEADGLAAREAETATRADAALGEADKFPLENAGPDAERAWGDAYESVAEHDAAHDATREARDKQADAEARATDLEKTAEAQKAEVAKAQEKLAGASEKEQAASREAQTATERATTANERVAAADETAAAREGEVNAAQARAGEAAEVEQRASGEARTATENLAAAEERATTQEAAAEARGVETAAAEGRLAEAEGLAAEEGKVSKFYGEETLGKMLGEAWVLEAGLALGLSLLMVNGYGSPDQGKDFTSAGRSYTSTLDTLALAAPSENWQGDAADQYAAANDQLVTLTSALQALDKKFQPLVADNARANQDCRDNVLICNGTMLGAIPFALMLGFIPPPGWGRIYSLAFQAATVAACLSAIAAEMTKLDLDHATPNGDAVSKLQAEAPDGQDYTYDQVASAAKDLVNQMAAYAAPRPTFSGSQAPSFNAANLSSPRAQTAPPDRTPTGPNMSAGYSAPTTLATPQNPLANNTTDGGAGTAAASSSIGLGVNPGALTGGGSPSIPKPSAESVAAVGLSAGAGRGGSRVGSAVGAASGGASRLAGAGAAGTGAAPVGSTGTQGSADTDTATAAVQQVAELNGLDSEVRTAGQVGNGPSGYSGGSI